MNLGLRNIIFDQTGELEQVLGIIATNYPYGYGEPFLHEEVKVLSGHFKEILVIIPEAHLIKQSEQLFDLPPNVFILPVYNRYSINNKLGSFARIGIANFFKMVKIARRDFHLPLSWPIIKIFMAYVGKEYNFRKKLIKELKKRSISFDNLVLYSYWMTEYTYAISLIKQQHPEISCYSRVHGWDLYFERHNPPYLPFRKTMIPLLDKVFVISKNGVDYLKTKLNLYEDHFEVQRIGVTPGKFNTTEPRNGRLRILTLSFIVPIKNLELFISALERIDHLQIEWTHIGGGEESYENRIKKLASTQLSRKSNIAFKFLGNYKQEQVRNYLENNSIDVLVNTSRYEGLPVSMMEAMSHGIPVIAPDIGGIPEIVESGKNGFLYTLANDPTTLVEVITNFSSLSTEKRIELRKFAVAKWNNEFNASTNFGKLATSLREGKKLRIQSCTRCILSNQDYPEIKFDDAGVCDICHTYELIHSKNVFTGIIGQKKLTGMIEQIRKDGRKQKYDCLVGVSGGVDSTYLVYLCKQWGLRPLAFHVDNGWNAELAIKNIENILRKLGLDLHTKVLNWEEIRDLQLAYFKASVVDIDVPADNCYIAAIYKTASRLKIKHVLMGHNVVTEGWLPPNFNHYKYDLMNLRDIHRKFGSVKIKSLPLISSIGLWYYTKIKRIRTHSPLNLIDYKKDEVKQFISEELSWKDYGEKHFENIFTRFYQGYILPEKFHVDKKKAHLSTLICSGQITREEALREYQRNSYNSQQCADDKEFFIKKMNLTEQEFRDIMQSSPVPHTYYKSILNFRRKIKPFVRLARKFIKSP